MCVNHWRARLSRAQTLAVRIDALGLSIDGRVEEIVPQSEPGSRSVLVKVALAQRADLYPGMFGRLIIPAGQAHRLYVPEAAVQQVGQLTFVWVLGNGTLSPTAPVHQAGRGKEGRLGGSHQRRQPG